MKPPVSDIAFTPSVKAVQERLGSRKGYASMEQRGGWNDVVTSDLAAFIADPLNFGHFPEIAAHFPNLTNGIGIGIRFRRVIDESLQPTTRHVHRVSVERKTYCFVRDVVERSREKVETFT